MFDLSALPFREGPRFRIRLPTFRPSFFDDLTHLSQGTTKNSLYRRPDKLRQKPYYGNPYSISPPNGPGEVATKAGARPRHLTFHPNGKFAYLITETTATIGTYAVDPASGTLKELRFIDTNEYKEQPAASDIHRRTASSSTAPSARPAC